MKQEKKYGLGGCFFWWLVFLGIALLLFSCSKEPVIESCQTVIQMKKVYNNTTEWRYLRTEVVKDFGKLCGDDLKFFQVRVKDTVQLCFEPVMLYWVIK